MAVEVKRRRGSDSEHNAFTGAIAELTVNTTNNSVHVHDGSTTGGFELLRADANNSQGSTTRTNLGLAIGTDVQAQNSTLQDLSDNLTATASELNVLDGATVSTAELNLLDGVTATTAELNQLDGNDFTSGIMGTTADFSGALDADTLRTDSGKFLSPNSYQFRNAGDTAFRDVEMAGVTASGDIDIAGDTRFVKFLPATAGGGGTGITYKDSGGVNRLSLHFEGSDTVILGNRAANGEVQIRANTSTAGLSGEITVATFKDTDINLKKTLIVDQGDLDDINLQDGTGTNYLNIGLSGSAGLIEAPSGNTIDLGISGSGQREMTISADEVAVNAGVLLTAPTIETDTLRTTLFKPTIISGIAGETVFNAVSQVTDIDTGANTITFEDAVFNDQDYVAISSGNYNSKGFSNTRIQLTSAGSSTSDGTQHSYTVDTSNGGSDSDISTGDTGVKANGNMIYVDARDGTANGPKLQGYQGLTNFSDSPVGDGSASPNWDITPEFIIYDGMTKSAYNAVNLAGFSAGDTAVRPDNSFWKVEITGIDNGTSYDSGYERKISSKFYLPYGITRMRINAYLQQTSSGSNVFVSTTWHVRISIGGVTKVFNPSSASFIEGTMDISSLSEGHHYAEVEIRIEGTTNNNDGTNSGTVTLNMREDVEFLGMA